MRASLAALILCLSGAAAARDLGEWTDGTDGVRAWFGRQMQPDYPAQSCCGEADAYWADAFEISDGRFFAIVTDERDDAPLQRPHLPPGTRVEIPPHKFKDPRGDPNPTGHGIVFLRAGDGQVYCYFNPPGGV
jgi:hypothetical protein